MIYRTVAALLLLTATAFAAGSIDVMDPITKIGKRITGGDGIDITGGIITNTGVGSGSVSALTFRNYTSVDRVITTDPRLSNPRPASDVSSWAKAATKPTYTAAEVGAAPVTSSRGILLFSSTGCAAGWQTTMATEIAQYAAAGIQADHIVCYPYTASTGNASFTFPSVGATGAAGSVATAYTADAGFSFPAVSGTGAVGTFTAAGGATGDAMFTFPSVSGDGAAGVMTASYMQDGSFTFPAVTGTGAVGTLTVAGSGASLDVTDFEASNMNGWAATPGDNGGNGTNATSALSATTATGWPHSGTASYKITSGLWDDGVDTGGSDMRLFKTYPNLAAGTVSVWTYAPNGGNVTLVVGSTQLATQTVPAGVATLLSWSNTQTGNLLVLLSSYANASGQVVYLDDISVPHN